MDTGDFTPNTSSTVSLREITKENGYDILKLQVTEPQKEFVASNVYSLAEAYLEPHAWPRAIYADETPVGFLMIHDDAEKGEYFLWRFMIDARYQGMGFGRRAIELLIEHVKSRPGATELLTSCVPDLEGNPEPFYARQGFVRTGEVDDGEVVLRLKVV